MAYFLKFYEERFMMKRNFKKRKEMKIRAKDTLNTAVSWQDLSRS